MTPDQEADVRVLLGISQDEEYAIRLRHPSLVERFPAAARHISTATANQADSPSSKLTKRRQPESTKQEDQSKKTKRPDQQQTTPVAAAAAVGRRDNIGLQRQGRGRGRGRGRTTPAQQQVEDILLVEEPERQPEVATSAQQQVAAAAQQQTPNITNVTNFYVLNSLTSRQLPDPGLLVAPDSDFYKTLTAKTGFSGGFSDSNR